MKTKYFIDRMPEDWIIRKAKFADAEDIAKTHSRCLKWTYTGKLPQAVLQRSTIERLAKKWKSRIKKGDLDIYVAYQDKTLLAFLDLDTKSHGEKTGEMHRLYSNPDKIMKRPGYFLFRHVVNLYKEMGYIKLFCWVVHDNLIARRFYEKMGLSVEKNKEKHMKLSTGECLVYKYQYIYE